MPVRCSAAYCIAALLALAALPSVAAEAPAAPPSAATNRPAVLIAAESSRFKDAFVAQLTRDLESLPCSVKVADLNALAHEPADAYRAIVVVNTCWAWSLDRRVKRFLARTNLDDRVVLVTTAGDAAWKPRGVKVDAITAASAMEKADPLARDVLARVRRKLGTEAPEPAE